MTCGKSVGVCRVCGGKAWVPVLGKAALTEWPWTQYPVQSRSCPTCNGTGKEESHDVQS